MADTVGYLGGRAPGRKDVRNLPGTGEQGRQLQSLARCVPKRFLWVLDFSGF
jgi:hypothetical protein